MGGPLHKSFELCKKILFLPRAGFHFNPAWTSQPDSSCKIQFDHLIPCLKPAVTTESPCSVTRRARTFPSAAGMTLLPCLPEVIHLCLRRAGLYMFLTHLPHIPGILRGFNSCIQIWFTPNSHADVLWLSTDLTKQSLYEHCVIVPGFYSVNADFLNSVSYIFEINFMPLHPAHFLVLLIISYNLYYCSYFWEHRKSSITFNITKVFKIFLFIYLKRNISLFER